jgi:hypothetical protein
MVLLGLHLPERRFWFYAAAPVVLLVLGTHPYAWHVYRAHSDFLYWMDLYASGIQMHHLWMHLGMQAAGMFLAAAVLVRLWREA